MRINFIFDRKYKEIGNNSLRIKARKIIRKIIDDNNKIYDIINYRFCDDESIIPVNKEFLKHDYPTDIITFSYHDENEQNESDILISLETVLRNSRLYKTEFENEMFRVIIHGALHLCGFEDRNEKEKKLIKEKENYYLLKLNF